MGAVFLAHETNQSSPSVDFFQNALTIEATLAQGEGDVVGGNEVLLVRVVRVRVQLGRRDQTSLVTRQIFVVR